MIKITFNEYQLGKREQISLGKETAYGTGVTPTDILGLNAKVSSPDFNYAWQEVLSAGADTRAVESFETSHKTAKFTMEFTPVNWKFLQYVGLGVADAGGPAYTHTFTLANTIQSFTLQWAKRRSAANHVITAKGCIITSLNISIKKPTGQSGEGFIKVTAQCIAQDWTLGTTVTSISAITASPFQFRHFKFTLDNNEITEVNNADINIDNGVNPEESRYANATLDQKMGEPIPGVFRINGRLSVNTKDSTYDDANDTAAAISNTKMEFIRGANDDIDFTYANFIMKSVPCPTNMPGINMTEIVWSDTFPSSLVATDSISTY